MSARTDGLSEAVSKLLDHLDGRRGFEDHDWQVVLSSLTRIVRGGQYRFPHDEEIEIAMTAVTKFIEAVRAGKVDRSLGGVGYLVEITRHEAATVGRRHMNELIVEAVPEGDAGEVADPDTGIDDLVNELADTMRVRKLFQVAIDSGRHDLASFIRVFLNLADEGRPTLRRLGEALDLSPSSVSTRLQELRELLRLCESGHYPNKTGRSP